MIQLIISRILLTYICLVTITISGQQQDVCSRFTYKFTYQPDSSDVQSKRQLLFYLLQKNDSTLFTQAENKRADSLEHLIWEQYKQSKNGSSLDCKGVPHAAFKYYILKNISSQNGLVTVIDKVRTTNYQYSDSANFTWNIFPDTKVIAGFPVQKAETYTYGRKFTAWFSAEIPISDGPYTFRGLPGLILEIYDTQEYFTFTLQEHQRLRQTNCLQLPPLRTRKLLATTRPKFREVEKAYREGPVARIMNGPFAAEVPASRLQEIRERIKKNNNILERQ